MARDFWVKAAWGCFFLRVKRIKIRGFWEASNFKDFGKILLKLAKISGKNWDLRSVNSSLGKK